MSKIYKVYKINTKYQARPGPSPAREPPLGKISRGGPPVRNTPYLFGCEYIHIQINMEYSAWGGRPPGPEISIEIQSICIDFN